MEQFNSKVIAVCPFCKSTYKVASNLAGKQVNCGNCKKQFAVDSNDDEEILLFCKIALNYGYTSEEQLENVLTEFAMQPDKGGLQLLEAIFIESGVLSPDVISMIRDIQPKWGLRQREKKYASAAVEKGYISVEKAKSVLIEQAKLFSKTRGVKTVKDYLLESNEISVQQHEEIAAFCNYIDFTSESEEQEQPRETKKNKVVSKPDESPKTKEIPKPERVSKPEETPKPEKVSKLEETQKTKEPPTPEKTSKPEESPKPKEIPTPEKVPESEEIPKIEEIPESATASGLATDSDSEPNSDQAIAPDIVDEQQGKGIENSTEIEPVAPTLEKDAENTSKTSEENPEIPENKPEGDEGGPVTKVINGLVLEISEDGVIALLRAPDGIQHGTNVESIKNILAEEGINFGIVADSLIKGFLNSKVFREKPFKIAEGRPPVFGVPGSIKYHFDTDHLKVGTVSDSGDIDFKNRGEIPFVKEGSLLAEITPAIIGENGVGVYGQLLAVPQINPVALRCEEGTELSESGLKVYAKNDGQPKLTIGGKIYVLSELKINGDVGFETGHIEFAGDVVVLGTIQSDFIVKGVNVTAEEVLTAEIIAAGNVNIQNGITGGKISAEGDVTAKFINKGYIKAFGNVVVEREIIETRIANSGMCQVAQGKILASNISSKLGVKAAEIGTEMSKPSRFKIGVDDHINDEVQVIDDKIEAKEAEADEIKSEIESLSGEEKKTHLVIAELAHVQDRSQLKVNSLTEKLKELKELKEKGDSTEVAAIEKSMEELQLIIKKSDSDVDIQFDSQDKIIDQITAKEKELSPVEGEIDFLKHERKSLVEWAEKRKSVPSIQTTGVIHAGTTIIGPNSSKVIKEIARHVTIREVRNPDVADGWDMRIM